MFERLELVLKIICVALAALLLFQVVRLVMRSNPLAHLSIPAVPTLPPDTNAPAGGTGTNALAASASTKGATNTARTGVQTVGTATNASAGREPGKTGTNAPHLMSAQNGTNPPPPIAAAKMDTNSPIEARSGTKETNTTGRLDASKTNLTTMRSGATNRVAGARTGIPPQMAGLAMGPSGRPGAMSAPELPLPIRARVYQITDSEVLGPVMHPLPMALLGIAGDVAFLRSASGQTGLAKEGESVGGLKLIRIGTNRVLVEDDGQQKELTIFSGYGGESLLPKQKESSQ